MASNAVNSVSSLVNLGKSPALPKIPVPTKGQVDLARRAIARPDIAQTLASLASFTQPNANNAIMGNNAQDALLGINRATAPTINLSPVDHSSEINAILAQATPITPQMMVSANQDVVSPILNAYNQQLASMPKQTWNADVGLPSKQSYGSGWQDLFTALNDTLGQFGGGVRTAIDSAINTMKNGAQGNISLPNEPGWMKTIDNILSLPTTGIGGTAENAIVSGAKNQWNDWTDGKLSWGDVPGFGFLHGMSDSYKSGLQVANDVGFNPTSTAGKIATELGVDIATDPLTYLTGGTSLAEKAGTTAALNKIKEIQDATGVAGKFKTGADLEAAVGSKIANDTNSAVMAAQAQRAQELAQQMGITDQIFHPNDLVNSVQKMMETKYPNLAQMPRMQESIMNTIKNEMDKVSTPIQAKVAQDMKGIEDAVQAARAEAYNSSLNKMGLSIPFTNKAVATGEVPEKILGFNNPLYRTEAKLGDTYKNLADNVIQKASHDNPNIANELNNWAKNYYQVGDLSQLTKSQFGDMITKLGNKQSTLDNIVNNATKATDGTTAVDNNAIKNVVNDLANTKYTKLADTKTAFGHKFDQKNIFNARTLATKNDFINSMANHIADGGSMMVGRKAQYSKFVQQIDKFIKKNDVQAQDMKDAVYHLENQAPISYGKDWVASDKAQGLAARIKPLLDLLGTQEQKAGVLNTLREHYFPHVLNRNMSEEDLKAMKQFQERHPELTLRNQSEQNKFNQERTGFQTMAEHQNYLDNLQKAISKETDPTKLEDLQSEYNRVKNMYEPDISKALVQRVREGVRAQAMKAMNGELKKYGMLRSSSDKNLGDLKDLKQMTPEEVKKFGLDSSKAHYIHPDVLNGMKKIDQIFTAEGMGKFVRQVNAFTNIFRSGVTTFKFSHYFNNTVGNVINNMAAGVKLRNYTAAGKLINKLKFGGKLSDGEMKLLDTAYKHNVISGGFVSDLTSHGGLHFDDPTTLEKVAHFVSDKIPGAKKIRAGGEFIDDISRLANFMNGLEKFGDATKAAKQVETYLFNYNEMTNADRTMRFVVPFWNWTKRNIPLQIKNLVEKPAIAMNYERTKNQINSNIGNGADWQKDTGVPLPSSIAHLIGGPAAEYYTSIASPTDDLKQVMDPTQLIGSMGPVFKIPIELMFNKQMYTGNPISYGSKTVQGKDIPGYVAKNFGVANDISTLLQSISGHGNKTPKEVVANYFKSISKVNQGSATPK